MINYQCFERLAMIIKCFHNNFIFPGDSDKSEAIKMYFVKLREFITENQHLIYQALENKDDLRQYYSLETMPSKRIKYKKVECIQLFYILFM